SRNGPGRRHHPKGDGEAPRDRRAPPQPRRPTTAIRSRRRHWLSRSGRSPCRPAAQTPSLCARLSCRIHMTVRALFQLVIGTEPVFRATPLRMAGGRPAEHAGTAPTPVGPSTPTDLAPHVGNEHDHGHAAAGATFTGHRRALSLLHHISNGLAPRI